MSFSDISFMKRALALAENALPNCPPNPAVGCVIVKDRKVIGEGFTQKTGEAHAEIMALRDAQSRGESVEGATIYVSLEPCSHYGRTHPCALALINAKVGRVVAALKDPNPAVAGRGLKMLEEKGVQVESGICAEEAEEMNIGFLKRMRTGLPFVRSKIAMSLDGDIALSNGQSKWITGKLAREDGQMWRARAGAILTGSSTVAVDNPQLNVRLPDVQRQPLRVIVDSHLTLNPELRIFETGPVLLVCSRYDIVRAQVFEDMGVEVLELPGADGKVDLQALIKELARREINEIHVEAGPKLNGALTELGLIDEYLIYMAPKLLGEGMRAFRLPSFHNMEAVPQLEFKSMQKVGEDVRFQLRPLK